MTDRVQNTTKATKRAGLARSRRLAGHTQGGLAARLGVDRSTVARWESGEASPGPTLRPKLASTLGITPYELDILLSSGGMDVIGPLRGEMVASIAEPPAAGSAPLWSRGAERTALAMRRRGAGFTQDSLAHEIGVARSTVMRWERGLVVPALPQQRRLARALQITTAELSTLLGVAENAAGSRTESGTDVVEEPNAVGSVLATARVLREEMAALMATGAEDRLSGLEDTVDKLRRAHVRSRAMETVFALVPVLSELRARVRDHHSSRVVRRFQHATAMSATMLADALFRLGKADEARGWHRVARTAADGSGDPQMRAQVRAQQAILTYYTGDLNATIGLTAQAQAIIGDRPSPAAALASAAQARALARMGNCEAAKEMIVDARRRYEQLDEQPGDDVFAFPAKRLFLYLSGALSNLGCVRYAPAVQDKGLRLYAAEPDTFGIDPMLLRFDQAVCMAQAGELGSAAAHASALLTDAEGDGDRLPLALIRAADVATAIEARERSLPDVNELRELIAHLASAPAQDD
ncbi:helix-turn-helix transcriptional regulator [Saccharopolyspora taberi]|uniref:HTH cro/C1-type domain-containing protein n=1 Tax=Saccharopolyspora taberi TaxID=60895 RepID=A0ABN3VB25_9PSEU